MASSSSGGKRRKKTITEEDIATLLQRYDAKTILKLLQEISYYSETKMDWCELVKKTTTGITNPREYQLLWRHLSYRDPLLPVEDHAQPLDDDSDMECELEASPSVNYEASMEANAYVKVMAASYVPSDSDILDESTVEGPLTINIPCSLPESPWSLRGKNVTFPVFLHKATSTEGMNGNGGASSSMASRRKRIKWSPEEDEELIAAVNRCGEGNWAHIVKGDFRGERTASQLSQRWALIRKRCHIPTPTPVSQPVPQRTDTQKAVNHALSLALGSPPSKKPAVGIPPTTSSCGMTQTQVNGSSLSQGQKQSKTVIQATAVPAPKPRVPVRKTTPSSSSRSDLMVKANSVAAAACMSGLPTAALVPKIEPGKTDTPLVSMAGPVTNGFKANMPRPSGSFSVPKVEQGKRVAASSITNAVGSANPRPLANGGPKIVTAAPSFNKHPLPTPRSGGTATLSASKIVPNQRVVAASIPAKVLPPKPTPETITRKPDGVQRKQAGGDGASSLVANQSNKTTSTTKQATQAPLPRRVPPIAQSTVLGSTNKNLVDKPSGQTAMPSISGAESQSKVKCEANNKVGPMIKVSNACGKPPEVATVGGAGQGV